MLPWKLSLGERVLIGSVVSASILGITSYYLGLIGLNVNTHWFLPIILIAYGIYAGRKQLSQELQQLKGKTTSN